MRLLDQPTFKYREGDFLVDAQTPCSLLPSEPVNGRPVRMRRGPQGRVWQAQRAGRPFTVTIKDGHPEGLSQVLRQCSRLPLPYMVALDIVSEAGKDGLALYKSIGGAAGHGGEEYVNVINSALPLLLHEFGHTIEQRARNRGNTRFLDEWEGPSAPTRWLCPHTRCRTHGRTAPSLAWPTPSRCGAAPWGHWAGHPPSVSGCGSGRSSN